MNQQTRNQETTTPKGRTRRTIPMTGALHAALKRLETIREGFVVRNLDGSQKTDGETAPAPRIRRMLGAPGSHLAAAATAENEKAACSAA